MQKSTWLYFHDIFLAHLNLLESLDDIKGKGDRAGYTARYEATEEVDDEIVIVDCDNVCTVGIRVEEVFSLFIERPVEGREGNVSEEGGRISIPQSSHTLASN